MLATQPMPALSSGSFRQLLADTQTACPHVVVGYDILFSPKVININFIPESLLYHRLPYFDYGTRIIINLMSWFFLIGELNSVHFYGCDDLTLPSLRESRHE